MDTMSAKSEYDKYLERQRQVENTFDTSAADALTDFVCALPVNLGVNVLARTAQSLEIARVVASIDGYQYEGSIHDKGVFWRAVQAREWSRDIVDVFAAFFEKAKGGCYIDFGANIGLTTVPISRKVAGRCYAVEAIPENYGLLKLNLLRNGAENCTAYNVAISDREGTVKFELSERNFGDHRIRTERGGLDSAAELYGESLRKTVVVPAIRCDDLFADVELASPLAIKSDMQGADGFLFEHGQATLSRCDLLVTEYWPYALVRAGFSLQEIHAHYRRVFSHGHIIDDASWRPGQPLLPIDELIDRLLEEFKRSEAPEATSQEKTKHLNVILAKDRMVV
jgi:FkbM family methyltransferase